MLATRRSHAGRVPIAHQPRFRNAAVKRRARRTAWPSVIAHLQGLRAAFLSSSSGANIPARHGPPSTLPSRHVTPQAAHSRGFARPSPARARRTRAFRHPPARGAPQRAACHPRLSVAALAVVATPTAIARLRACALRCECPSHQSLACARTPLVGCFT